MQTVLQLVEPADYPDGGKMNGVAYDTAWAARVKDQQGKPLFPECVKWLLENQHINGSWGGVFSHVQYHVLSTLVSIIALSEINKEKYKTKIHQGEIYIWNHIDELGNEDRRLAAIELIFPALMMEAEDLQLNLPFSKSKYEKERRMKLGKIDKSLCYNKSTTLAHAIEFLGDEIDPMKAGGLLSKNGSVFNSPASTAYILKHTGIQDAYRYLRKVLLQSESGSMATVYPFEIFESSWMMYNFMVGGIDMLDVFAKYCDYYLCCMSPRGIPVSACFPLPDADDTAVVAKILARNGISVSPSVFESYSTGEHFVTYGFETESSITTNLHILDFLKDCRNCPQEITERLLRFVQREMRYPGYWIDKWHASVYYPTAHAILALVHMDNALASRAVSWILETQNENGMWGYEEGTIEETAYAVQALMYYHMNVETIDLDPVVRALPHLLNMGVKEHPDFWAAKALYFPTNIVRSAVVSAVNMSRRVMKRSIPLMGTAGI